jgi:hypothetical protein
MPKSEPSTPPLRIHIRLPQALYHDISHAATTEERSLNSMLVRLLRESLLQWKTQQAQKSGASD